MTLSDDFDSRSKSLTAAGDDEEPHTGVGVFLIPAEDDPINAASSEDQAHMTTIGMGTVDDLNVDTAEHPMIDIDTLMQEVRQYAAELTPITVPVSGQGQGELGDEGAIVVFLEPTDALLALRDGFLLEENIGSAYSRVEQYDPWTPHVTLGYPETPAAGEYDGDAVTFDRVGLWVGAEQYSYPMGETVSSVKASGGIIPKGSTPLIGRGGDSTEAIVPLTPGLRAQMEDAKGKFARLVAAGIVEEGEKPAVGTPIPPEEVADDEMPPDELEEGEEELLEIPVHGVATLEGKSTGDGRGFRPGAIKLGAMPQPLGYEYVSTHGGDTSNVAVVGRIDEYFTVPSPEEGEGVFEVRWRGVIMPGKEYGARAIESIVDGSYTGLSVIVDSVTVDVEEEREDLRQRLIAEREGFGNEIAEGEEEKPRPPMSDEEIESLIDEFVGDGTQRTTWFSDARVRRFDMVPTGAFQEGYVALGHEFADEMTPESIEAAAAALQNCNCGVSIIASAADGGQLIVNLMDLTPDELDAYDAMTVEEQEAFARERDLVVASAFAPGTKDGPGWITHPTATSRIRQYWVSGKGAAKIAWGTPGDFNRCRMQLAKYVENPEWLAGLCANMHKEAIGVWPGQEGGRHGHALVASAAKPADLFSIVASAAPLEASLFKRRELENPRVGIVVDGDAVYGYIAQWNVCHVGINDKCTMAPRSPSNYGQYRTGTVNTTEGLVSVGQITMNTGHAGGNLSARATVAHYDNTGTVVADVTTGEDQFGIWFAGRIRPHVSEADRFALQASGRLSGDWRTIGGVFELVAALCVNVPGFPIPEVSLTASAEFGPTSLVAAGVIRPEDVDVPLDGMATLEYIEGQVLSADDIAGIAIAAAERVFDLQRRQQIIDEVTPAREKLAALTLAHARRELTTMEF